MSNEHGTGGIGSRSPASFSERGATRGVEEGEAERPLDLVEVSGRIKWFDVSKGFGFIVPDDGAPDILLHVTCLRRDGHQAASEGARIVVEAVERPRGWQAFRVVSLDQSTAIHPSELPMPRTHVSVTPTSGLETAVVKWFNRLRGFGFLSRGDGSKGAMAAEVRLVDGALPASH